LEKAMLRHLEDQTQRLLSNQKAQLDYMRDLKKAESEAKKRQLDDKISDLLASQQK
jgi:hypothetical protein